jgi:lysophospholipase L1-like esterase
MQQDAVHAPRIVILDFIGNYGWPCQVGSRHDAYLHDYQTIRSIFPSTTNVLVTIPPAIFAPALPNMDVAQAVLDSGLPTIDVRSPFGGESPDPSLRTSDGVHLSTTGQTLYASILLASVACPSHNCPTRVQLDIGSP